MSKSISIHPEGFLNPTMAECIICGKVKPFLAFLGDRFDGVAPFQMVLDTVPCMTCWEKYGFAEGTATLLVEANNKKEKAVPTGRIAVAIRQDMKKLFDIDEACIYLLPEDYCKIIQSEEKQNKDQHS